MEKERLTRRDFIKLAAATGGAAGLYWLGKPLIERERDKLAGFSVPQIPEFPHIPERVSLPTVEGWNADRLETYFKAAIKQSLENSRGVEVKLPEGEIVVDRKITVEVPKGAVVKISAEPGKSRLRLVESLSKVPRRNLLEFANVEGELYLSGIDFDGGSERAGKGDYIAPPDPWDAVVIVRGGREGEKAGKVTVANCRFANSESVGLVTQNLEEAMIQGLIAKNVDGAWTANWCREIKGTNVITENTLSDGLYFVECDKGTVRDVLIKSGRQGVDIHGCDNLSLRNINVLDCAIGLVNSRSLRTNRESKNLNVDGYYSQGCGYIFSLGYLTNGEITRSSHESAGQWFRHSDFIHKGVEDYETIKHYSLYFDYASVNRVRFDTVQIRKDSWAPGDYQEVPYEGVEYFNF